MAAVRKTAARMGCVLIVMHAPKAHKNTPAIIDTPSISQAKSFFVPSFSCNSSHHGAPRGCSSESPDALLTMSRCNLNRLMPNTIPKTVPRHKKLVM